MRELTFEWDEEKDRINQKKHGVSFEEARSVFYDDSGIEFFDDNHSEWEDRFLLLGMSSKAKLLLVCHCFRESESLIRIISARKATKKEQRLYHQGPL